MGRHIYFWRILIVPNYVLKPNNQKDVSLNIALTTNLPRVDGHKINIILYYSPLKNSFISSAVLLEEHLLFLEYVK